MEIQERVLSAFQQEHREYLEVIRSHLSGWPKLAPGVLEEIFRMAHSIKGGARVCDLATVEKLAHYVEHLFAGLMRGDEKPVPELRNAIEEVLNAIEDYMAALAGKRTPEEPLELLKRIGESGGPSVSPAIPMPVSLGQPDEPEPESAFPVAMPSAPAPARMLPSAPETVRVNAAHLDRMLQSSGSLLTEGVRQSGIERDLRDLASTVEMLQRRCESELSSGELVRSQANSPFAAALDEFRRGLNDVGRRLRRIRASQQEGTRAIRTHGEQLQSNVRNARMVPAASVFEGFTKMVRDLAREEGKQVEFTVSGLDREVDRLVLQALRNPVMHALRNAVSHGIEKPDIRLAAGKPAQGVVRLEIIVSGSEMQVRVVDDGRGPGYSRIQQRAVEKGLLRAEDSQSLSNEETLDLLFHPGFSTAAQVTNVSGRGIGLSIVKEAAIRLQGSARIAPGKSGGCILTIAAPLNIATHRVLLVRAAGQIFAIPSNSVTRLQRVAISEIHSAEGRSVLMVEGRPVLLATLGDALNRGAGPFPSDRGFFKMVLLRAGWRLLAVVVDEFVRELPALIKPLPYPASASPFFSGGVILEDGSVVLALNVSMLVERFKGSQLSQPIETVPLRAVRRKPSVLVVDDSFTARTLQKSILETAGYEVKVAVDGEQALSMLRANFASIVVTDVQMPRMDGFRLLEEMKQDDHLKAIPVILVTSLDSEEDQARGLSLGADAYIVKQKFDHGELLNVIRQLV